MKYRIEIQLSPGFNYNTGKRLTEPTSVFFPQYRQWWNPFWRYFTDFSNGGRVRCVSTRQEAEEIIADDMIRRSPRRYVTPELDPQVRLFQ